MSPNHQKKSRSAPDSPSSIKFSEETNSDSTKFSSDSILGFFYKLFDVLIIAWFVVFIIAIFVSIIPSAIEAANRPEVCTCQQGGEQDAASS